MRTLRDCGILCRTAIGVLNRVRPSAGARRRGAGNAPAKEPSKRAGQLRLLLRVRRIIGGRSRRLLVLAADTLSDVVFGRVRCGADYFRRLVRPSCGAGKKYEG